jgi:hypothetical protein
VEGLAEYYTHGGLDPETEVYLRDLVWNPDPERRHEVVSFGEDRLRGFLPTYKLGQARVAFVAEVFGEDRIQSLLENAPHMGSPGSASGAERGFAALVRRVLGEDLAQVDARWKSWMKRRYYADYLKARQELSQVRPIPDAPDEVEAYAVSPDGSTVLTRQLDRERGRVRLYLLDPRWPQASVEVAADNRLASSRCTPSTRAFWRWATACWPSPPRTGPPTGSPPAVLPAHPRPRRRRS